MRKLLLLLLLVFTITHLFSQVDLEFGLVAHYPFDGNGEDETSFQNHAIDINGAFLGENCSGEDDKAFYFDGIDDYIEIPHKEQLQFGGYNDIFALAFWIKIPAEQENLRGTVNDVIGKWNAVFQEQGYDFGIRYMNENHTDLEGRISFVRYDGPPGEYCYNFHEIFSARPLNDDKWHHVVVQKNQNRLISLYVDGVEEAYVYDRTECEFDNFQNLTLGLRTLDKAAVEARPFKGALDELRVYQRYLTQDEISLLYKMGNCDATSGTDNPGMLLNVIVYPNPISNGTFSILQLDRDDVKKIDLYDITGRYLADVSGYRVPDYASGNYLMRIQTNNGFVEWVKVVIIR